MCSTTMTIHTQATNHLNQHANQYANQNLNQNKTDGVLYVVATPIGNLSDISQRAIATLNQVDLIACEDTRTSGKLLQHLAINTPTWAYHEHNADVQTNKLIEVLQSGKSVALISDAGTPLVSDPGFQLVRAAHATNVRLVPIVGASAAIAALSVAGLPSNSFSFIGFLPAKTAARKKQLIVYAKRSETLIIYEAPHRILSCLHDMAEVLGNDREITYCRELTKTFETVVKTTLSQLIDFVSADANQQKGEIVLVVAGQPTKTTVDANEHDALLLRLLEDLTVKKAAALAADLTGIKKNAAYQRLLTLQKQSNT